MVKKLNENIQLILPVVGNTDGTHRQARVEVGENYSEDDFVDKKDVEGEDDLQGESQPSTCLDQ